MEVIPNQTVPVSKILMLPEFDLRALPKETDHHVERLAKSIADLGLLCPVVFGRAKENPGDTFLLVGFSRYAAFKKLGMEEMPGSIHIFESMLELFAYARYRAVVHENITRRVEA